MLDDYFGYIYDPKLFLNTIMIKVVMVKCMNYFQIAYRGYNKIGNK